MVKAKLKEQTRAKKEEKKAKKRKHEEVDDVEPESAPAPNVEEDAPIEPEVEAAKDEQPAKKKSKKRKTDEAEEGAESKPKKQKKNKPVPKPDTESNGDALADNADEVALDEPEEDAKSQKKQRFIVFVGNLPYKTTKEDLEKYFAAIKPQSIRLLTDRQTKKPKGIAFLEFAQYDRMKTCLKKYHHTMLTDSHGNTRKINVELSAGGGGNSEHRKEKIRGKNEKLSEERKRYMEEQAKLKDKKEAREAKKANGAGNRNGKEAKKGEHAGKKDEAQGAQHEGIHPSRLAQMRV